MKLLIVLTFLLIPLVNQAQMDCTDFLKTERQYAPYVKDNLSKSARCKTGKKYSVILPLAEGTDYRIMFYASPIFNNDINFKIIDQNKNKVVVDRPGKSAENKGEASVLEDSFDEKTGKVIHPYFDFSPEAATNLEIAIDIPATPESVLGCIGILVFSKKSDGNYDWKEK